MILDFLAHGALVAFLAALGASSLRQWRFAAKTSLTVAVISLSAFTLIVIGLVLLLVSPRLGLALFPFEHPAFDPAEKARATQAAITRTLKSGALAAVVSAASGGLWFITRKTLVLSE
ncbi:MAG: hypothetical protein RJA70_1215 [Pseudomonadota bacterium]|jgi:hypothetical protein